MAHPPPINKVVGPRLAMQTEAPIAKLSDPTSFDHKTDPEVASASDGYGADIVLSNERELVANVISTEDDPSLNPSEIYYFKPQTITVSLMFLAVISYIIGFAMETFIPRRGFLRYLNPHPFNKKENAFIVIMASAASNAAAATEVLAVQRLYYGISPNPVTSVFLLFSSQMLGYGIGGVMRSILLYPSKMFYPTVLPLASMLDTLFQDGKAAQRKIKIFWLAFSGIFIWELFPEWIFPLLTGISVFCLAAPNNATVSRLFGGSNGNEGLGFLSICLDWQYVAVLNPLAIPLKALLSALFGYLFCIIILMSVYYNNIWEAKNFPLVCTIYIYGRKSCLTQLLQLSQLLFYENGTVYDQSQILNSNYEVDAALVAKQGVPYYASTWVVYLLGTNLALTATITHLILWNRDDLRSAWSWLSLESVRRRWKAFNWRICLQDSQHDRPKMHEDLDPHYAQMLKYPDAPNSWYTLIALVSFITALVVIYKSDSTLPWWSLVVAILLAALFILFVVTFYAMTGIPLSIQTFVQMIAGYLHRGKPMANMYFVLYSYNTMNQAQVLLRDLKIAQYTKLPPRIAFMAQVTGTLFGAILNYAVMNSIVDNQHDILLSVQGTNVWSGQQVQQYNSQAIAWGAFSHELFSIGSRYQWVLLAYLIGLFVPVPFWLVYRYWPKFRTDFIYTPIICGLIGTLSAGINSPPTVFFIVGFFSQGWLRVRHPAWFQKYNYILAAALDGGTQVMVFILSFAVFGAAGYTHLFHAWWGANQGGNYDHCLYLQ
ncbi:hypothetical protein ID866_9617 [Astraeus odoratus]|nr:hypothetical protein ID866_9617 [Astraeus odoratus]